jgi:hypothetical protein
VRGRDSRTRAAATAQLRPQHPLLLPLPLLLLPLLLCRQGASQARRLRRHHTSF